MENANDRVRFLRAMIARIRGTIKYYQQMIFELEDKNFADLITHEIGLPFQSGNVVDVLKRIDRLQELIRVQMNKMTQLQNELARLEFQLGMRGSEKKGPPTMASEEAEGAYAQGGGGPPPKPRRELGEKLRERPRKPTKTIKQMGRKLAKKEMKKKEDKERKQEPPEKTRRNNN